MATFKLIPRARQYQWRAETSVTTIGMIADMTARATIDSSQGFGAATIVVDDDGLHHSLAECSDRTKCYPRSQRPLLYRGNL